jgi:hypothetical protein
MVKDAQGISLNVNVQSLVQLAKAAIRLTLLSGM